MAIHSTTFSFTGEGQKWVVPDGVEMVSVEMTGGGSDTRQGGKVTGQIRVKGQNALWIGVGRKGFAPSGKNGGGKCYGGGGRGGDGTHAGGGAFGGGGASVIRLNKFTGTIRGVAAGAGGSSGDGGTGGRGGAGQGESGSRGTAGSGNTGDNTGGSQNQAGKGATSILGKAYWGNDGEQARTGDGGGGAQPGADGVYGGGGGGGGFYPGAGGAAGRQGDAPGTGGSGGSNYIDGMVGGTSVRGTGGTGHGSVTLTWDTTNPPSPPSAITIDGHPIEDGLATKSTGSVLVKGTPHDPDAVRGVRMLIWRSKTKDFATHSVWKGTYDDSEDRDKVTITGLDQDTLYYLRFYTQDVNGALSPNYTSTNFWTNRPPNPPTLTSPPDNAQISTLTNVTFEWNSTDPDSEPQAAFNLRYRKAATPISDAGDWVVTDRVTGDDEEWTIGAGTFKGNTFYEWQVRTQDAQDAWGEWSFPRSFYGLSSTTPPLIISPVKGEAIVASQVNRFRWKFRDPEVGVSQARADLRYAVLVPGVEPSWITVFGSESTPGSNQFWDIDPLTFEPGFAYLYEIRTIGSSAKTSDWSEYGWFWTTATPGSGAGLDVISSGKPQDPLGRGDNRAFVFTRGGTALVGELTPLSSISWNRKRDDISSGSLVISEWDDEAREFLGGLRSWQHEVVVFRDGVRVFEGPITHISSSKVQVEIEFKDVMAYVYRRIMRQGYSDAYKVINGEQVGLTTVVNRAAQIILNALAYDDPNVLPYLTILNNTGDAKNSRVRKDFSSTAWEEVDDLAAHAGLDYVTAGRRIILNDTHRPVGRLPEMRDGDFSDPPVITEYGMNLANVLAVTNNNGIYGVAYRGVDANNIPTGPEGFVEMLDSAYGESEGAGTEQTLTREAQKRLVATMTAQAVRNIGGRYTKYGPSPLVVRVPDNSTLSPEVNLGINQLIPGVWIPVRSNGGIRDVAQWQKLDAMGVTQDGNGEQVSITMSPAPNDGQDPDADEAAAEEA